MKSGINTILIKKLQVLTLKEMKMLRHFIQSPLFNSNRKLEIIFDYICKYHPENLDEINRAQLLDKVYQKRGNVVANNRQLTTQLGNLSNLVNRFYAFLGLQSDSLLQDRLCLRELLNKQSVGPFKKHHYKVTHQLNPEDSSSVLYHKFQLESLKYRFLTTYYPREETDKNLAAYTNSLDLYTIVEQLKNIVHIRNRQNVIGQQDSPAKEAATFQFMLLAQLPQIHFDNPLFRVYKNLAMTLYDMGEENIFENTFQMVMEEAIYSRIHSKEMYIILTALITYVATTIKTSNTPEQIRHNYKKIYELYDFGLKKEFLFAEGFLHHNHFKNMISIGTRLKKKEWLTQYINEVQPDLREYLLKYYMASIALGQKEYDAVEDYLGDIHNDEKDFPDIFYLLNYNILFIKSLYSKARQSQGEDKHRQLTRLSIKVRRDFDRATNTIDKFLYLLNKRKNLPLPDVQKNGYIQFLKYLKSIVIKQSAERPIPKTTLQNIREANMPKAEKDWLLRLV